MKLLKILLLCLMFVVLSGRPSGVLGAGNDCCNDAQCGGQTCANPGNPCPPGPFGGSWGQCTLGGTNCGPGIGAGCPAGYTCVNGDCVAGSSSPPPNTDSSCGNAAYPACSGVCGSGTVCRANEGNRACVCGDANSCADYIGQIADPTVTRLSDTAVRVGWNKPRTGSYVTELTLTLTPVENNQATTLSYVLDPQLGQYDVFGLAEGTYYTVTTRARAAAAPGFWSQCASHSSVPYLSSCSLTPDPLNIDVGQASTMTTGLASGPRSLFDTSLTRWVVTYSSSNRVAATVTHQNGDPALFRPYTTTVTGVGQGTATVTTTVRYASGLAVACTDTATVNVGDIAPPGAGAPWWQVVGGGVYAGDSSGGLSIRSEVPAGEYLLIPGSIGSVAALMRASGTYETGSGSLSVSAWNALTKYRGKRIDYAYFAAQLGVGSSQANDWGSDDLDQPAYDPAREFYYQRPATEVTLGGWNVLAGEKYVVVVRGNVRITGDVTVANGGYLMVIAQGDVTVDPAVTSVQGIYLANGLFITESAGVGGDVQLVVSGSVAAWDGVDLNRDLGVAGNVSPAEQFVYRPDLMISMPKKVKTFVMEWQEVPAGTFGN